MIKMLIGLVARSLRRILSAARIEKAFAALPEANKSETPSETDEICVCAMQLEAKLYGNLSEWLTELDGLIGRAVAQGAQLICLPEFYGMMPVFLSPVVHLALRFAGSAGGGSDEEAALELFPLLSPLSFAQTAYEDIICRFARRYGVFIFGGTYFAAEDGSVFNRGFLVTDTGELAARQDKIFLTAEELSMGLRPGDKLNVIPTKLGNIALSVCMDATYFETFKAAKAMGADYIIVPIGDTAEQFSDWLALRGAQARVNETGLPAIKPALVSAPDFPISFTGKAGIYFPLHCRAESTESECPYGAHIMLARFSIGKLRSVCTESAERLNPAFDEEYLRCLRECCAAPKNERRKFK